MTRPVMNQMFMLMMMTQEIPKHLFPFRVAKEKEEYDNCVWENETM